MQDIVISGAKGGMGSQLIKILLNSGKYRVFACELGAEEVATENYVGINLDVTDEKSLERAKQIVEIYTKELYAVVNLAGIFGMDSIVEGDEDKLRKIFEVNFWGTYRMIRTFLPMLAKNKGRIINMSSELARYSVHPFDGYYALPKIVVDNYSDCLRRECNYFGIKVVKIQSGSFKTNLVSNAGREFDNLQKNTKLFAKPLKFFRNFVYKELDKVNDPIIIAKVLYRAIDCKRPRICYRVKNSLKLRLLNALPSVWQDKIYNIAK